MCVHDLRVVASDYVGLSGDVKVYTCNLASTCFLYKPKRLLLYCLAEQLLGDDVRDDMEGADDLIDCLPLENLSGVADVCD
jgi:hypothetical protein